MTAYFGLYGMCNKMIANQQLSLAFAAAMTNQVVWCNMVDARALREMV
jgi:hypothetical protein